MNTVVVTVLVHVALTLFLLAYVCDVLMPFYAYRRAGTDTAVHPTTSLPFLEWPLFLCTDAARHTRQLEQHIVHGHPIVAMNQNEEVVIRWSLAHLFIAAVTYPTLRYIMPAPYGRHAQRLSFQLTLPSRVSWILQESPTLLNVLYFVLLEYPRAMGHGPLQSTPASSSLSTSPSSTFAYGSCASYRECVYVACSQQELGLLLFVIHYVHRSWIYPLSITGRANRVPTVVTWMATVYCLLNGRLQVLASAGAAAAASSVMQISPSTAELETPSTHLPRCLIGHGECGAWRRHAATSSPISGTESWMLIAVYLICGIGGSLLFIYGYWTNMSADYYLLSLRDAPSDAPPSQRRASKMSSAHGALVKHGYKIPMQGWFQSISCANFFGEFLEWVGFLLVVTATSAGTSNIAVRLFTGEVESGWWGWWLRATPIGRFVGLLWSSSALAALSFVVYVWCNLAPRAVEHHRWYLQTFGPTYAALRRKALLPGLY